MAFNTAKQQAKKDIIEDCYQGDISGLKNEQCDELVDIYNAEIETNMLDNMMGNFFTWSILLFILLFTLYRFSLFIYTRHLNSKK